MNQSVEDEHANVRSVQEQSLVSVNMLILNDNESDVTDGFDEDEIDSGYK